MISNIPLCRLSLVFVGWAPVIKPCLFVCLFVSQVNLDDLFSPLQFRCVRRSGLSLLRQDDQPEEPSRITGLRAMEISAFRVEIN